MNQQPSEDLGNTSELPVLKPRNNVPFTSPLTPIKSRQENHDGATAECTGIKMKHPNSLPRNDSLNKSLYSPRHVCSKKHKKSSPEKREPRCSADQSSPDVETPKLTRHSSVSELSPSTKLPMIRRFSLSHIEEETLSTRRKKISASEALRRQALMKIPQRGSVVQPSATDLLPVNEKQSESLWFKDIISDSNFKSSLGSTFEVKKGDIASHQTKKMHEDKHNRLASIESFNEVNGNMVPGTESRYKLRINPSYIGLKNKAKPSNIPTVQGENISFSSISSDVFLPDIGSLSEESFEEQIKETNYPSTIVKRLRFASVYESPFHSNEDPHDASPARFRSASLSGYVDGLGVSETPERKESKLAAFSAFLPPFQVKARDGTKFCDIVDLC